eukprot:scaffold25854_cov83-Skeletonema_dohrnii-CCMP3373.AAC.1
MALVRALQLFFRGSGAARLHDSRGQSHFSFSPVVLCSVWELHISHNGVSSVCSLVEWSKSARLHGSCRQSLFSSSFVEAGRLVYMTLVVRVTSASVMLWWVWDGSSSLAICRVACSSVADDAG